MHSLGRALGDIVLAVGCATMAAGCERSTPAASPSPLRLVTPTPSAPAQSMKDLLKGLEAGTPGIHVVVQPSAGSVVVVSQLQKGNGELGLAQSDVVYLAFMRGTPEDHRPHANLRAIAVGGLNRLVVYVRRTSTISGLTDLKGKRVAISPPGTAGELLTRIVLEASGLSYKDLDMRVHQIRDMGANFDSEQLDAMIMVGGFDPEVIPAPVPNASLRLVAIDPAVIERVRAEYPFIKPAEITWHDDRGRLSTIASVGADSLLIARKDVPEALVYAFTAAVLRAVPRNNPFAIDPDTAPATPIPLHPGAARYYRELQLLR